MKKMRLLISLILVFSLSACSLFRNNSVRVDIKKDNYKVIARYPKLQSPSNQRLLKQFIMKQITKFQESYGTDNEEYRHKLKINYKIFNSKTLKSIVFRVRIFEERDIENLFFKTFVFNKDTEEQVLISDILDSPLKLMVTSQLLRDRLKRKIPKEYYDHDRVLRGTMPKARNFRNFYYDKNDLHILFGPFELANFEAGYFDLVVDFSKEK